MSNAIEDRVRNEIENLHEFFVDWFSGRLPVSDLESACLNRFAEDMIYIAPGGQLMTRDDLTAMLRAVHGSNPDFRIQIRQVRVHRQFNGHVLATYEEWQRNALSSTPADNARLATVLFASNDSLRWLHVHETWLPEPMSRD